MHPDVKLIRYERYIWRGMAVIQQHKRRALSANEITETLKSTPLLTAAALRGLVRRGYVEVVETPDGAPTYRLFVWPADMFTGEAR